MITLHVEAPYASFRKSFARSFAETYSLPPPATVYGMLLSLVGEHFRDRHEGVRLAFAHKRMPRISTTLRKLSRYKYGVPSKQSSLGKPDFIETLCGIEFLCWVDSAQEMRDGNGQAKGDNLEKRLLIALRDPQQITRRGIVYLGLSDDAVNDISICDKIDGRWHRLLPDSRGRLELPIWADHVRGFDTRWQRYEFESEARELTESPGSDEWKWTEINDPRKRTEEV